MRNIRLVWIAGAALAGWLAASSGAARAELLVTESTVDGVAMNAAFTDGATFDVPAGKKIKFLKKPENTTHEIDGPYRGTLAGYKPGCGWWAWTTGKCGGRTGAVEGGSRSAAPVPGGTRDVPPPSAY